MRRSSIMVFDLEISWNIAPKMLPELDKKTS